MLGFVPQPNLQNNVSFLFEKTIVNDGNPAKLNGIVGDRLSITFRINDFRFGLGL
ncbi:MAG: hypothetical protein IE890_14435 [Arcobacter sp.]|nr:hypothetical protein [Arcobacter sp.]